MPYKRFSPAAYTFLVTDFGSVFRRIDFFNTHVCYRQLRVEQDRPSVNTSPLPGTKTFSRKVARISFGFSQSSPPRPDEQYDDGAEIFYFFH